MTLLGRSAVDQAPPPQAPPRQASSPDQAPAPDFPHRGRAPAWHRAALVVLLLGTGALYLWDLGASGYANSFYSAAAQAGSESWKAFFFAASDAAGSITVDKTPASIWVMALSVRVFGLSSWSILVPQALMGVGSVALLYATVKRATRSAGAGLVAGVVLAATPVAALMFRFNNPDALLVLLLVGSVYATLRAVESPRRALRWLALGGALVGLAFLTKMLQAFLVLPALALVYAVEAKLGWLRKLRNLLVAFGAMIVSAGWWVAIVALWPASSRPYIGGSQNNSILELTLGYNGFGRLTGNETGSVGGGRGGTGGQWGETGLLRLFNSEIGGQIAWLLPAALALLVLGIAFTWRTRSLVRASLIVWGGWLLVTGLTFSLMAGIFHAYYTVALAPAIAALVGTGAYVAWQHRNHLLASVGLAVVTGFTACFAFTLLGRYPDFLPWLRWAVLVAGLAAAAGLAFLPILNRKVGLMFAGVALISALAAPGAFAIDTAATSHSGSIPSAGPTASTSTGGGRGGGGHGGGPGGFRGGNGGGPGGGNGGPGTQQGQQGTGQQGTGQQGTGQQGPSRSPGGATGATDGGRGGNSVGGLLNGSTASSEMVQLLSENADDFTWVAATVGSNSASGYQLATGYSVMPIGGFNGTDPSPTLAQFEEWVSEGKIHYFIAGGGLGGSSGSGTSSQITSWVEQNFTATTVGGVTVYDLSGGNS
ncbi:MAG: glycosyltransferase family 39 protein [Nocardioidaceae bacterium]